MALVRQPSIRIPVTFEPSAYPPPASGTLFRLIVSDVWPEEFQKLKSGLETLRGVEWYEWRNLTTPHYMVAAFGRLDAPVELAADQYLRTLTLCAWDMVGDVTDKTPRDCYPDVWLDLNPNEPDELTYSYDQRHWGQYRWRRRRFEAQGGNVAERWPSGH